MRIGYFAGSGKTDIKDTLPVNINIILELKKIYAGFEQHGFCGL